MLKPGGVLRVRDVVYNFDPADAKDRLEAWCTTGADDGAQAWSHNTQSVGVATTAITQGGPGGCCWARNGGGRSAPTAVNRPAPCTAQASSVADLL